jgi:RNA polymerase sigma-70 factor (ECF subfamily)
MKIRYDFVNGETKEIEIDEKLHNEIKELDRQLYNNNQSERRRHCSADDLRDSYDYELIDETADPQETAFRNDEFEKLIACLGESQKDLVRRVFFHDMGISRQSAKESFDWALKKIKKVLCTLHFDC